MIIYSCDIQMQFLFIQIIFYLVLYIFQHLHKLVFNRGHFTPISEVDLGVVD